MPIAIPFIGLLAIAGLAAAAISGSPTASKNTKTIAKGLDKKLNDWQKDAMMTATKVYIVLTYADVVKSTIVKNFEESFKKNYPPKAATPSLIPTGIPIAAGLIATTLAGHLGTLGQTGDKSISLDTPASSHEKAEDVANVPDVINPGDPTDPEMEKLMAAAIAAAASAATKGENDFSGEMGNFPDIKDMTDAERKEWLTTLAKLLAEQIRDRKVNRGGRDEKNISKNKAFAVAIDIDTGKFVFGMSGQADGNLFKNEERAKSLITLEEEKVEGLKTAGVEFKDHTTGELNYVLRGDRKDMWDCAEPQAVNNLLNLGAELGPNILVISVELKKGVATIKPPCENCQYYIGDTVTLIQNPKLAFEELYRLAKEEAQKKLVNSQSSP